MSWTDRMMERVRSALRAYILGPAAVDVFDSVWGHSDEASSPAEMGSYLRSSNSVYTCATVRADQFSALKFKAYKSVGGKRTEVVDGPVLQLLRKVNPFWTMNRLQNMSELCMCVWGKNFWAIERGDSGKGKPREIWWMRPNRVTVVPDARNYISKFIYEPISGGDPLEFAPSEVVWFRFPDPNDEFGALSPLLAARMSQDVGVDAANSNSKLFRQGYHPGGFITPPKGVTLTPDAAKELEKSVDRRFKGVDKHHRWAVLRFEAELKSNTVTPKDAEWLGALNWTLEEAARALKLPLDMVGGQRTYENVKASDRALWMRALIPESLFFCSEIVEQLFPMFGADAPDELEHDLSKVPALQDDEKDQWAREYQQIQVGALKVNEWRKSKGMEEVPWGNAWWASTTIAPVTSEEAPAPTNPQPEENGDGETVSGQQSAPTSNPSRFGKEPTPSPSLSGNGRQTFGGGSKRAVEYGSEEHVRLARRFERRAGRWEKVIGKAAADLFERQKESVIARLKAGEEERVNESAIQRVNGKNGRAVRTLEDVAEEPFDMAEWIKKFRMTIRLKVQDVVEDIGQEAINDLGLDLTFNVKQPAVARFIERRAQRFAVEVNETTWDRLRKSLGEGLDNGEGLPKLIERVEAEMEERIRSSGEVIARTEVVGASNGGLMEAWKQTELKGRKAWLSALQPDRTRDSHIEAHERYQAEPIELDEDFEVGNGRGPHPGAIGLAEEDINCLCSMVFIQVED